MDKETIKILNGMITLILDFVSEYVFNMTYNPNLKKYPLVEIQNGVVSGLNDSMASEVLEIVSWLRQQYEGSDNASAMFDMFYTINENEKMGNLCCCVIGQAIQTFLETAEVIKITLNAISKDKKGKK